MTREEFFEKLIDNRFKRRPELEQHDRRKPPKVYFRYEYEDGSWLDVDISIVSKNQSSIIWLWDKPTKSHQCQVIYDKHASSKPLTRNFEEQYDAAAEFLGFI